jgi:hypothetical protein
VKPDQNVMDDQQSRDKGSAVEKVETGHQVLSSLVAK